MVCELLPDKRSYIVDSVFCKDQLSLREDARAPVPPATAPPDVQGSQKSNASNPIKPVFVHIEADDAGQLQQIKVTPSGNKRVDRMVIQSMKDFENTLKQGEQR